MIFEHPDRMRGNPHLPSEILLGDSSFYTKTPNYSPLGSPFLCSSHEIL